jgi:thiamine biosynthesis protein ThiI
VTDPSIKVDAPFVLVHYSEIALKGRNRAFFENSLVNSLRKALKGLGMKQVKRLYGRILLRFHDNAPFDELRKRLQWIYGISNFEHACQTELDINALKTAIVAALGNTEVDSFAVVTRRSNKTFPMNSVEVNREIGQAVVEAKGWKVQLSRPDLSIFIYVLDQHAYFTFEKVPGPGGMPVGTAGRVVCLISGGIDSPVASYRVMRRGCQPVFVHFHSAPHTSIASQEKVVDLTSLLVKYHQPAKLYLVPFADLQREIVARAHAPLRVILYRRFMIRAAEAIARREKAVALVTGESLGQVASQTLTNLATIQAVSDLPILRPLICQDKQEIINEAQRLGTFDISIEPDEDCCSFLMPKNPATFSNEAELCKAEEAFDIPAAIEALGKATEVRTVGDS